MALRIRSNGKILCAALHKEQKGDTYIPDSLSEIMSGATGLKPVIVTNKEPNHSTHGEWWWVGNFKGNK